MTVLTENDEYYTHMASAIGDKSRILPFVKGKKVLDIGAGGGQLALKLADAGYYVTALDALAPQPGTPHHQRVKWVQGRAENLPCGVWDTVIASSVFHEVFSHHYVHESSWSGLGALIATLSQISNSIEVGGHFVIRDGVAPHGNQVATMEFRNQNHDMLNDAGVKRFLDESPFTSEIPYDILTKGFTTPLHLTQVDEGKWVGSPSSVMEAFTTLIWGSAGFNREVNELYGVFTLEGYRKLVEEFGFTCIHMREYVQPGYISHSKQYVELTGFDYQVPYTNALWVFRKDAQIDPVNTLSDI